jgi:uncharacterized protein YbjT (DUF2867 family)
MQPILVTGATGNIAGATLQHLTSSGADIRALVRNEAKAEELKRSGVDVVVGDLSNPHTLDAAFAGVGKVLLITPVSLNAVEMVRNAIAAAKKSGKPHIVQLSANVPEPANVTEVGRQRTVAERELRNSGLPYTIIQPTFFMQNTMMAGQTVAAEGRIYMPCGQGQFGMIDLRDVGAAVAKVLASDGHVGKTYVLTGPASISFNDVASTLASVLDREVAYVNVPFEAAKEAMVGLGMPAWLADIYNELFKNFSQNGADFTTDDVERITGQPATSYRQFAKDFAGAFGG